MIGENGERTYDAGDTGTNVFAIPTRDQDTLPPPKVFSIRGEEPSTKFYIRLDGEFVCKVEVDRGAWGEYDDNPIDVLDWQLIMIEVRKFTNRTFVNGISYETICNSIIGYDVVLLYDHDGLIVNRLNLSITLS